MIVLGEKREGLNVVHLIMGPETEFQFDMSGQSIIDITDHCKKTEENDHMILVLNRCTSEEKLAEKLAFLDKNNKCDCEECNPPTNNIEKEEINYKCPICFENNKGIYKDGLIIPCKSCQKISEGLDRHGISQMPSPDEIKNMLEDMLKKNPKQFELFIDNLYNEHNPEKCDDVQSVKKPRKRKI